jgi:hypothetical protein
LENVASIALAWRANRNKIRVPSVASFARHSSAATHCNPVEEKILLTEAQVQRSFRDLFKSKDVSPDAFEKAEALLDELRAESPLRHRLSVELEDIRKLHEARV